MSFQDDAIEPLTVESAEHFTELLRRAAANDSRERIAERHERHEPRRALPRELERPPEAGPALRCSAGGTGLLPAWPGARVRM